MRARSRLARFRDPLEPLTPRPDDPQVKKKVGGAKRFKAVQEAQVRAATGSRHAGACAAPPQPMPSDARLMPSLA
jgi:hypothetical protein